MSSPSANTRIALGRGLIRGCLGLALMTGCASVARAQIPSDALRERLQPQGSVSDFANVLSDADRQAIEQRLEALRSKTGAQVAVVTLDTLEGGEVNDFTSKLFQRWGVGEKGKNNGVMLLVAIKDHKDRIEVGYGLEPILPDALAGRILTEQLAPAFRRSQYGEGLRAGVDRIAQIIERGQPPSAADLRPAAAGNPPAVLAFMTLFLSMFVAVGFLMVGAGLGARVVALILVGGLFGGLPLVMAFGAGGSIPLMILLAVALAAGWSGYRAAIAAPEKYRNPAATGRKGRKGLAADSGGWTWGAASSGGSSGGGFSSGGFSSGGFGGGSSGGGGASGSW